MANKIRMTIDGDEELIAKFKKMQGQVSGILEDAAMEGAEEFQGRANNLAPGPHIEMDTIKKTKTVAEVDIGPDDDHWYYRFFETGTAAHEVTPRSAGGLLLPGLEGGLIVRMITRPSGMAARPFMRPAFDEKKKKAADKTGARFWKEIEKNTEK